MAQTDAIPLTEEERAELERLRAEKAQREREERDRRERAELERLRAESREAVTSSPAGGRVDRPEPAAQRRPDPSVQSDPQPEELTFGQRMVTTPEAKDDDDVPGMAPAQKIIIAFALLVVVAGGLWIFLNGGH